METVKDHPKRKHSLSFAIWSVVGIYFSRQIILRIVSGFSLLDNSLTARTADGLIRAFVGIISILVLGKIIGSNGFKFAFTTKGFKKGMFAHIAMIAPIIFMPFIVLSIPQSQLDFSNAIPHLLPYVIFHIGNAVWEDVAWNGVLMTGAMITYSATWNEPTTVRKRVKFMLMCSFAFGLVHFGGGGILHVFSAVATGVAWGAAYIYSKNLPSLFITHFVMNYVTTMIQLMLSDTELVILFVQRFFITNIIWGIVVMIPFAIYLTIKAEPFWSLEKDRSV